MNYKTAVRSALKKLYEEMPGVKTVYLGRRRGIPSAALPALCVYLESEEKTLANMGTPRAFDRTLRVETEIHVRGSNPEAAEELLDYLCTIREETILTDETLGGLVESILPTLDEYQLSEEPETAAAVAKCSDIVMC